MSALALQLNCFGIDNMYELFIVGVGQSLGSSGTFGDIATFRGIFTPPKFCKHCLLKLYASLKHATFFKNFSVFVV